MHTIHLTLFYFFFSRCNLCLYFNLINSSYLLFFASEFVCMIRSKTMDTHLSCWFSYVSFCFFVFVFVYIYIYIYIYLYILKSWTLLCMFWFWALVIIFNLCVLIFLIILSLGKKSVLRNFFIIIILCVYYGIN